MLILCTIITIIILLMELMSLYIWLTKKYLPPKAKKYTQLKKQIKEFYRYKRKIDKNEIVPSDSMNIFLEGQKKKYGSFVNDIIFVGLSLIIYAITCSLILGVVLFFKPKYVILFSLCILALEVYVFLYLCRKFSKSAIERLDDFILFLFYFGKMLKKENKKDINASTRIYNTVVTWVALVLSIVIVFSFLVLLKKHDIEWRNIFNIDYKHNPVMVVALLCIIGVFLALLHYRNTKLGKKEVTFDTKLALWENDVDEICKKLHIKNVEIKVVDDVVKEAVSSTFEKYEVPQIRIGGYFLNDLKSTYKSEIFYNIILFILGHELSHISSKDSLNKGRFKFFIFLFIGNILVFLTLREINLALYNIINTQLFLAIFNLFMAAIIFRLDSFFYKTWTDERYWKQVYELRADRIGFQLSNISVDIFKKLMFYFQTRIETEDDFHPLYETRVREIEKYNNVKWGIKDQLRYTWKFIWNLKVHKEWRL